jgi:hypothetical protein
MLAILIFIILDLVGNYLKHKCFAKHGNSAPRSLRVKEKA